MHFSVLIALLETTIEHTFALRDQGGFAPNAMRREKRA